MSDTIDRRVYQDALEIIKELEAEVAKLRARSPRTKIEGVECECGETPRGVNAILEWGDLGVVSLDDRVLMSDGGWEVMLPSDVAEVLASKLHWCARVARGEDVADHARPGLVPAEELVAETARADQAEVTITSLREQLLATTHRDLLGRAAGREMVGPLHLARWAELEAAGWVVREGEVFALTPKGEEVWRG